MAITRIDDGYRHNEMMKYLPKPPISIQFIRHPEYNDRLEIHISTTDERFIWMRGTIERIILGNSPKDHIEYVSVEEFKEIFPGIPVGEWVPGDQIDD